MAVRHILADGTEVASIEGRVIRRADFPGFYELIARMNKKNKGGEKPSGEKKGKTA